MVQLRAQGTVRGSKLVGDAARAPKPRPELAEPEDVADPLKPRRVVDYTMRKRSALGKLVLTATGASDNLDPHPDLLRAAKYHAEPHPGACPWCKTDEIVMLRFTWGDELGDYSGRLKTVGEIATMAFEHGSFRVDEVEVCRQCHWHYLLRSYVLGDGNPRRALRAPRE